MINVFLRSQLEIETGTLIRIPVSQLSKDDFSLCKEGIEKHLIPENCGEKKNTLILTASKITYCSCCVRGCTQAGPIPQILTWILHSKEPSICFSAHQPLKELEN